MELRLGRLQSLKAMLYTAVIVCILLNVLVWKFSWGIRFHAHKGRQPSPSPGMIVRNPTAEIFAIRHNSYEPRLSHRGGWAVAQRCRWPLDVLVFVHCSAAEWQRRAALRDTLFEEAAVQRFNWTGVFFSGRRSNDSDLDAWLDLEADLTGDLVVFPIEDGVFNITPKLVGGMRWVADHCPTVKNVIKIDDDVMIEPFSVLKYYQQRVPQSSRYLHCFVFYGSVVYRDPTQRFYVPEEDFPGSTYLAYCSGRSVIMTYAVMRELLRASSLIPAHVTDDAYVFGDLALALGIGHVDIFSSIQWDEQYTHCIYLGLCIFTHETTSYGTNSLRRGQWGLLLWRHRLLTRDSVDLSPRLDTTAYREMFHEIKKELYRSYSTPAVPALAPSTITRWPSQTL